MYVYHKLISIFLYVVFAGGETWQQKNGGRTFVQRAFVQDWHFIAACKINMPY